MPENKLRIYDPETGAKPILEKLIFRLGIEAAAKKFKVSTSTMRKWLKGTRKPAATTLTRSLKKFI